MSSTRIIKSYPDFINENLSQLDEGKLADASKRIVSKLKDITNKTTKRISNFYSNYLNALKAQSNGRRSKDGANGTIPYGVVIIPSEYDKSMLLGKQPRVPVNEAQVGLEYPAEKGGVSDILDVDRPRLLQKLKQVMKHPSEISLMIWGAPGIGKTSIVRQAQKEYGGRMIDIQLTTYAPEDFFLPEVEPRSFERNPMSRRATRIPQGWLPIYHESEGEQGNAAANGPDGMGGVLFLDELSRANDAIRAIALKLVNERSLDGGWVIGSKWVVIAASNRAADDPTLGSMKFGSALGNRFQQVNYAPSVNTVTDYFRNAKHKETGENLFDPRLIKFLIWNDKQDYKVLHRYDPDVSKVIFPSPRAWEAAMIGWKNLAADAKEEGRRLSTNEIEEEFTMSVGKRAARELMGYLAIESRIKLDDLELVWTNPEQAPLPPRQGDREESEYDLDAVQIVLGSIAYDRAYSQLKAVNAEGMQPIDEPGNLIKYAVRLNNPTHAATLIQLIWNGHPEIQNPDDALTYFRLPDGKTITNRDLSKLAKESGKYPPGTKPPSPKELREVFAPSIDAELIKLAVPAATSWWYHYQKVLLPAYPALAREATEANNALKGASSEIKNLMQAN